MIHTMIQSLNHACGTLKCVFNPALNCKYEVFMLSVKWDVFGGFMYQKHRSTRKIKPNRCTRWSATPNGTVFSWIAHSGHLFFSRLFVSSCWSPQGDMPTNETMKRSNVPQFCCFVFVFSFFSPHFSACAELRQVATSLHNHAVTNSWRADMNINARPDGRRQMFIFN